MRNFVMLLIFALCFSISGVSIAMEHEMDHKEGMNKEEMHEEMMDKGESMKDEGMMKKDEMMDKSKSMEKEGEKKKDEMMNEKDGMKEY